ncbi:MAG: 23S rRNA (pseudouridine(1915)-N(3))-methyltransferase RlmH [Pseudomonadales bacterium]|nr:23S rRNA (pseudouridine(1915)-N(3))-methyltransferase RlmH [Pseudomonadales bacterium]MCP5213879.1 23S rRNA (pseudouridine(1915)-N(3))-methyltransferase RlmH [Pseudomonadales bacterium]
MRIKLIAVGGKMPDWVNSGFNEYAKRLPHELKLEVIEVPLGQRGKGADIQRAIAKESRQLLAAIEEKDQVVALDVKGSAWSTEQLAQKLSEWQMSGTNVALLVGGPDGLSPDCLQRAGQSWSLSKLTFPHPLVRVVVAEQLYRAWTLLNNHPYHRS